MYVNHTTPHISPPDHKPGFRGFSAIILVVILTVVGCIVAMAVYIRRRSRLDELRHRLIPLYTYDPAEEQDWAEYTKEDEDEELAEPLYKEGKLLLSSAYGT